MNIRTPIAHTVVMIFVTSVAIMLGIVKTQSSLDKAVGALFGIWSVYLIRYPSAESNNG